MKGVQRAVAIADGEDAAQPANSMAM